MLPTFSTSWVKQTTTDKARVVVLKEVRFLTDFLIRRMEKASARWKPKKEGP